MTDRRSGQCLCGAVTFEVTVPKLEYTICHCGMCRRWSAGPLMAIHCPGEDAILKGEGALTWYRGSKWAERGFCAKCGSSLFYRLASHPQQMLIVAVDTLDRADDITLGRHIYIDAKPDRYDFADDCPRVTEVELLAEFGLGSSTQAD